MSGLGEQVSGAAQRAALGNLGALVQSPVVRAAVKYWWITVPVGFAAWRSYQKRKGQGLSMALAVDIMTDIAPLVAAIGTMVTINEALHAAEARQRAAAPPRQAAAAPARPAAKDADFTLRRPAAAIPAGA